jgi:hypothetical protein
MMAPPPIRHHVDDSLGFFHFRGLRMPSGVKAALAEHARAGDPLSDPSIARLPVSITTHYKPSQPLRAGRDKVAAHHKGV